MSKTATTKKTFALFIAVIGLNLANKSAAQILTVLHEFTTLSDIANTDGANPHAGVILSGGTLYGTTSAGGTGGCGAVFAVGTNGQRFTNIHSFTALNNNTNSDGANPQGSLILSGKTLFGTTSQGGKFGNGVAFSVHTDGTDFKTLHHFAGKADGAQPRAALTLFNSALYGTAFSGGKYGLGTVFAMNTDGTGFKVLLTFGPYYYTYWGVPYTWNGANPNSTPVISGRLLYGTTSSGGSWNGGTMFKVDIYDSVFHNLHQFGDVANETPAGRLVLSGNIFYGTTAGNVLGYNSGNGTIFACNINSAQFRNLYSFDAGSDGASPSAGLLLSDSTMYGTATMAGTGNFGTLFGLNANGAGFTGLYSFTNGADGGYPYSSLVASGNTLYGTASIGGSSGNGTVFSLSVEKSSLQITINPVAVANAGAQWQVDSGPYLHSAATVNSLLVGPHSVAFKSIPGWFSPQPQFISTKTGTITTVAVTYTNVGNLFQSVQGAYAGLFAPADAPRQQTNSGAISFALTSQGVLSGKLIIGTNTTALKGQFNANGIITIITPRKSQSTLTTTLQLDFASQSVQGTVADGSFLASLTAGKNIFTASQKATAYEGQYTMIIPGNNDPATGPFGASYGTVTVSPTGAITFAGSLADGTSVSQTSFISADGYWPFYLSLYNGNGSLWSWNLFTNGSLISAPAASWLNVTNTSKTAAYRKGFTNLTVSIEASPYNSAQTPLLSLTNAQVTLDAGTTFDTTIPLTLTQKNSLLLTNTTKLTLTIIKSTGLITGTFANPSKPSQTLKVAGVLLQNQTNAAGYFLETNQSGSFSLTGQSVSE
ncbi:MAG TPA: choice-of-anchor tandem repeat GloVer-containing protein [Verrucomicrobiae bacterium]